jgi:hypothetical protein
MIRQEGCSCGSQAASVQQKSRKLDPASLPHVKLRTNSNRSDSQTVADKPFPCMSPFVGTRLGDVADNSIILGLEQLLGALRPFAKEAVGMSEAQPGAE